MLLPHSVVVVTDFQVSYKISEIKTGDVSLIWMLTLVRVPGKKKPFLDVAAPPTVLEC